MGFDGVSRNVKQGGSMEFGGRIFDRDASNGVQGTIEINSACCILCMLGLLGIFSRSAASNHSEKKNIIRSSAMCTLG